MEEMKNERVFKRHGTKFFIIKKKSKPYEAGTVLGLFK